MFILARYLRLTCFQVVLFVLFYFWMRGRYRGRRWFRAFTLAYAAAVVAFFALLWGYFLYGREAWFWDDASGITGDFFIHAGIAYVLASVVWFWVMIGAFAVRGTFRGIRRLSGFVRRFRQERIAVAGRSVSSEDASEEETISRRGLFARAGALAGQAVDLSPAIGTVGVLSGMFLGSREIVTEKISMPLPNLHDDLRGLRLVQISDIHVGSLITDRYLVFCLDRLRSTRGDLLVVTGDLIDFHNRALPDLGRFLNRAVALFPRGVLVIPGNHDYFYDGPALKKELSRGDFRLMLNQRTVLRRGRGQLELVGLDYPWPHYPGPVQKRSAATKAFFRQATRGGRRVGPRILLNHDPAEFVWLQNEEIDLMLSGHTHGGQVHVPGPDGGHWAPVETLRIMFPYLVGEYRARGRRLYVNRGLGHSLPLRLDCPPEISVFELG